MQSGEGFVSLGRLAGLVAACAFVDVFFTFILPAFHPIFLKLEEKGELPAPTECLNSIGQWVAAWSGRPVQYCFGFLMLADLGMTRWTNRHRRWKWVHWWLFTVVVIFVPLVLAGLLVLPVVQ
jgi:type II secretory pathway component PulF